MAVSVSFISLGVVGNTICNRSLSPESLCKCTKFPPEVLRTSRNVFVPSSPEDAYLRDDQDDAEQLTGLGSGSPRYHRGSEKVYSQKLGYQIR